MFGCLISFLSNCGEIKTKPGKTDLHSSNQPSFKMNTDSTFKPLIFVLHMLVFAMIFSSAGTASFADENRLTCLLETEHLSLQKRETELKIGANGLQVEALQRTLNLRLKPSPELSIDGDFGPATEAALRRYQIEKELNVTGVLDEATTKSLGQLVALQSKQGEPKLPPRREPDPLVGRPFVSCKAWAIADQTKVLFHSNGDKRLDIASTTKLMTAVVLCTLAEKDPGIWDETISFSKKADRTVGSTSGIRAGEQVKVSELIYGLLLPSGNDASVAFGEHLGNRCNFLLDEAKAVTVGEMTALEKFVSAMNATAKKIGMKQTNFRNPHGLTAKGHLSTANDLIKLAHHAMTFPRIKKVVNTRIHWTTVEDEIGIEREIRWKNTNKLLATKGYFGMKTGTTSAAGACLVSAGTRDGKSLFIVVLGSSGSNARYADSKNLYRWAWKELAKE